MMLQAGEQACPFLDFMQAFAETLAGGLHLMMLQAGEQASPFFDFMQAFAESFSVF